MPDQSPLSERTKVSINLVSALSLCIAVISATFFATNWFNDFLNKWNLQTSELQKTMWSLQAQLTDTTKDRWTGTDMVDYTRDLRTLNYDLVRAETKPVGLLVPDVRAIHKENITTN